MALVSSVRLLVVVFHLPFDFEGRHHSQLNTIDVRVRYFDANGSRCTVFPAGVRASLQMIGSGIDAPEHEGSVRLHRAAETDSFAVAYNQTRGLDARRARHRPADPQD